MGYLVHHAIVVTASHDHYINALPVGTLQGFRRIATIEDAAAEARRLGCDVLGPSPPTTNYFRTLVICPDGSKEGWDASDVGDQRREAFLQWLESRGTYEDGTSPFDVVEVAFGGDTDAPSIVPRGKWY